MTKDDVLGADDTNPPVYNEMCRPLVVEKIPHSLSVPVTIAMSVAPKDQSVVLDTKTILKLVVLVFVLIFIFVVALVGK